MNPQAIVELGISGVLLIATLIGYRLVPKDMRFGLSTFAVIGVAFGLFGIITLCGG